MRGIAIFAMLLGIVGPVPISTGTRDLGPAPEMSDQGVSSEPLVIVVNRANTVDNLSSHDLHAIFLGNRRYWSDGTRITLVMREPGQVERSAILRDVCGLTEEQFKTHFLRGLYTGEIIVSPKTLSTPLGVRRFIFNVPGAIGYLRMSDVDGTVKIVRIDEQSPGDKRYKLRVPAQAAN